MKKRFLFGEWKTQTNSLSIEDVNELMSIAQERESEIASLSLEKIYQLFDHVRYKWKDPNFEPRKKAKALLPELTGFSPEMIELGLEEIFNIFDPKILDQKVKTEFRDIPRDGGFKWEGQTGRALKWHPLGSVIHILSGNVFLVGPGSFIEGLLTGNVTILKLPSEETFFMPLFIETLMASENELNMEPIVSRSLATVEYSSSQSNIIEAFKQNVDGIVIWGGESAVQAYRSGLPARTRAVIFGPKLSVSVITKSGFDSIGSSECAKRIAFELSIWDQNACTAPQVCYVEGKSNAEKIIKEISSEFIKLNKELPAGLARPEQAAEIRKIRSVFEVAEILGNSVTAESINNLDWTVYLDKNPSLEPSPLHRTIKVVPFENIKTVSDQIKPLKAYVQTVGLISKKEEFLSYAKNFGDIGVLRIFELGKMSGGGIDDPHDGAYDLPQLMNLVVSYRPLGGNNHRVFEELPNSEQDKIIEKNILKILYKCSDHSYYKSQVTIDYTLSAKQMLNKVVPVNRNDIEEYIVLQDHEIKSCSHSGGVITRTGGTSGAPAFSYFDSNDWNEMIKNAVEVWRACGLNEKDHVACLMHAGDLYGSFISFHDANQKLGMLSLPFASKFEVNEFYNIAKKFQINVIQGMPGTIIPLLKDLHELDPNFTIEKVMYAGMPMSEGDQHWLRSSLNTKIITSVIGTTEVGQIGYQCPHCIGNIHHTIDEYNYIQIVDDKMNEVKDGEEGKVVVTALTKEKKPILRFLNGDKARIIPNSTPCLCGSSGRRMEYLGRCDDIISIGSMNLQYKDFEKALSSTNFSALQLVGDYKEQSEILLLNLEIDESNNISEQIVKELIFKNIKEFESFSNLKSIYLEISIQKPGSLPRNKRTGKLKLMIDNRFK